MPSADDGGVEVIHEVKRAEASKLTTAELSLRKITYLADTDVNHHSHELDFDDLDVSLVDELNVFLPCNGGPA